MAIPRYSAHQGLILFSAGFRPFFLLAAVWAALALPLWLLVYAGWLALPSALPPTNWHMHEMVFGYGGATVAGFLLTAIPNWTGRMPLQGRPLMILAALWALGRLAVLFSAGIGAAPAALLDLVFPLLFACAVGREILAGRNWRNLPMLLAAALLFAGNLLVHLEAVGATGATAALGDRLGLATLLMLMAIVGGRIVPSFTRNWLAKERNDVPPPAALGPFDLAALIVTALALLAWTAAPEARATAWAELAAGLALGLRLLRWRGIATRREPLVWILHLGYGWLALGFLLLAADGFFPLLPRTTALHALTVGAIGTMTLAVMTRASLGHTGRPLLAGPGTRAIYLLITAAALLRLAAPLGGAQYMSLLALAGLAWTSAFALFALLYAGPLALPRAHEAEMRPI